MKKLYLTMALISSTVLLGACQTTTTSTTQKVLQANVNLVNAQGIGKQIGTVTFTDSNAGLVIKTNLTDLPSGPHGFHIHENGACGAAVNPEGVTTPALQAGGHFDPHKAGNHGKPDGDGHLGDLPVLVVSNDQSAKQTLIAPRLNTNLIAGRAIMVHAGADNYSDSPQPLGGGGARIACGVISHS